MSKETNTFAAWCETSGISKDEAASLAEAAGFKPEDKLTEAQFRRAVPRTVEDFLRYAAPGISVEQRGEFLAKYELNYEDAISSEDFKQKLAAFKAERQQPASAAETSSTKKVYTLKKALRIHGKRHEPGEKLDLSDCPKEEIARLKRKEVI